MFLVQEGGSKSLGAKIWEEIEVLFEYVNPNFNSVGILSLWGGNRCILRIMYLSLDYYTNFSLAWFLGF